MSTTWIRRTDEDLERHKNNTKGLVCAWEVQGPLVLNQDYHCITRMFFDGTTDNQRKVCFQPWMKECSEQEAKTYFLPKEAPPIPANPFAINGNPPYGIGEWVEVISAGNGACGCDGRKGEIVPLPKSNNSGLMLDTNPVYCFAIKFFHGTTSERVWIVNSNGSYKLIDKPQEEPLYKVDDVIVILYDRANSANIKAGDIRKASRIMNEALETYTIHGYGFGFEFKNIRKATPDEEALYNSGIYNINDKPDPMKEILEECKKRYPVGTLFQSLNPGNKQTVKTNDHLICGTPNKDVWVSCVIGYKAAVYYNGKYADIITEAKSLEDDWKVGDEFEVVVADGNGHLKVGDKRSIFSNDRNSNYVYFDPHCSILKSRIKKVVKQMNNPFKIGDKVTAINNTTKGKYRLTDMSFDKSILTDKEIIEIQEDRIRFVGDSTLYFYAKDFKLIDMKEQSKPAFTPTIGKWYYITSNSKGAKLEVGKAYRLNSQDNKPYHHFDKDGQNIKNNYCWLDIKDFRPATEQEIINSCDIKVGDWVKFNGVESSGGDWEKWMGNTMQVGKIGFKFNDLWIYPKGYENTHSRTVQSFTKTSAPAEVIDRVPLIEQIKKLDNMRQEGWYQVTGKTSKGVPLAITWIYFESEDGDDIIYSQRVMNGRFEDKEGSILSKFVGKDKYSSYMAASPVKEITTKDIVSNYSYDRGIKPKEKSSGSDGPGLVRLVKKAGETKPKLQVLKWKGSPIKLN